MVEKFEIVVDDITTLSNKYKIEVEYIKGHKMILTLYKKSYSFTEFTSLESLLINFRDNLNYVNGKSTISDPNSSYYDESKLYENFPKYISGLIRVEAANHPLSKNSLNKIDTIINEFNKFSLKAYRREKRLQKILKTNED